MERSGRRRVAPRVTVVVLVGLLGVASAVACDLHLEPFTDLVDGSVLPAPVVSGQPTEAGGIDEVDARVPDASTDANDAGGGRKRVFVASSMVMGDFGGLAGGDAICQRQADAARLGGSFIAWLSVKASAAAARITGSGPWFLVDQTTRVFATHDALTASSPEATINLDETGKKVTGARDLVWTGTLAAGALSSNCLDFTSTFAGTGLAGSADDKTAKWTESEISDCSVALHLYCFER